MFQIIRNTNDFIGGINLVVYALTDAYYENTTIRSVKANVA